MLLYRQITSLLGDTRVENPKWLGDSSNIHVWLVQPTAGKTAF